MIKRDDQTGLAMGGNKTRKLEFLLAAAQAHGARTVVTAGAVQSNHCRQTAAAAARFGLECILVLAGESDAKPSGNLLLDKLLGAEIHWTTPKRRDQALQEVFHETWEKGRRPYLIPYGGSNPTGAFAYAHAIREFLQQNISVNHIVFASSSGGTQAGMLLGASTFGYKGRLLGISVDEPAQVLKERVATLANQTAELAGLSEEYLPDQVEVNDGYLGEGYGIMGEPEREAIHLFARLEGILLDPVYTGRAAAGMIDLIRRGYFSPQDSVLFWHTGGTSALFAEPYQNLV